MLSSSVHYRARSAAATAAKTQTARERGELGAEPPRVSARGGRAVTDPRAWGRAMTTRGATRETQAVSRVGAVEVPRDLDSAAGRRSSQVKQLHRF